MNGKRSKWIPRFFQKRPDGGANSGVTALFLIEWKAVFSIAILKFTQSPRENFHSHAFNAITWFLTGYVAEHHLDGTVKKFKPSFIPKFTPRSCFHRILINGTVYALTFRGPWSDKWQEYNPTNRVIITLTHGRKEI